MTVFALTVGLLLAIAPVALAYQFGEPAVRAIGPEERVFDWSTDACESVDIPDTPARAFRDDQGRVQLIDSHAVVRRMMGPDLNSVRHSRWTTDNCKDIFNSDGVTDPSAYNDKEWIHSTYTFDGHTIYGLVHNEYQGWNYGESCSSVAGTPNQNKCWYNAVTFAVSTNSGASYSHTAAPSHLVASIPYQYVELEGPSGVFKPGNIISKPDGHYYATLQVPPKGLQKRGVCLMRTPDLSDPTSWRAWNGTSFSVRFINPYVETGANPADHVCEPVSAHPLRGMEVYSVNWSTHFKKYVLVGAAGKTPPGFYFSLSDDLITWTEPKLLMAAPLPYSAHQCGDPDPVRDAALLDPATPVIDRNFEQVGKRPYLYFTEFNYFYSSPSVCWLDLDRDVMRIPIEFADPPPNQPPAASFTVSPNPALTGQVVTLNGSASSDLDGTIAKYEWDLDGNGSFEIDTGLTATTTHSYTAAATIMVGLRVTDNRGTQNETSRMLTVSTRKPTASFTISPNPALTGQVVTFNGSASSDPDGSIASYRWDLDGNGTLETNTGPTPTATRSYPAATNITVRLRVTDNDGAINATTRPLRVDPSPNQPPAASFTVSPNPTLTGQAVTFDGSASSDPDGSIANYEWDLDGNNSFETDTGTTPSATSSYPSARTVAVGLRVTDTNGDSGDTTRTLTVQNQSPTASFTVSPNPALAGQAVTFEGSGSSDPDGTVTSYKWDLDGNGSLETEMGSTSGTTSSYSTAATITVTLRVTDNDGITNDATRVLTVNASPIVGPPQPVFPPAGSSGQSSPAPVSCASIRQRRARLVRKRRVARRKFASARTVRARRHYTLRIRALNRRIKRLSGSPCSP